MSLPGSTVVESHLERAHLKSLSTTGYVQHRIQDSFLRLKVVHRIAPDYVCKLISFRVPIKYQLRAARKLLLMALRGKVLPTLRARALSSAAPYLWNHHRACLTLDLSVI